MDTGQFIAYLLGAGGGLTALVTLFKGLGSWISGSAGRERAKNTDLASQRRKAIIERDEALEERDEADRIRRIAFEYASKLRRQLIENGIQPYPEPTEKYAPAKTSNINTVKSKESSDD